MNHLMSPTGVAVLLLLALVVDYMSIGPDSMRDRLAFLIALPAVREGFDGSPLDQWTVQAASNGIDALKSAAGGSYIAGAATSVVLSAAIGILFIYTVGCLLPVKMAGRLGKFATLSWPTSTLHRINTKLWVCAILLGMLADLPGGFVGSILRGFIGVLATFTTALPYSLFGVS